MAQHDRELFVLVHGLMGSPRDMRFVSQRIQDAMPGVAVFAPACNKGWLGTLDGIDAGGLRVAEAVERELKRGGYTAVSLVGYSLGGLYVRYAARILSDRGVFEHVAPHFFITIGTPHLGSRDFAWPARKAIGTSFWRTGAQLVLEDDLEEPLLMRMCEPPYLEALARFHRRVAVGHVHDKKVGFLSSTLRHPDEARSPAYDITTLPLVEELLKGSAAMGDDGAVGCEESSSGWGGLLGKVRVPETVSLHLANWFGTDDREEVMVRRLRSLVWDRLDITNFTVLPNLAHSDLVARLPWNVACKQDIDRLSRWLAEHAATATA